MSTTSDKDIGSRLLCFREKSDLSQKQLSDFIGISLSAYQNYERGDRSITKDAICALMGTFDVDPGWLLSGKEVSTSNLMGEIDPLLLDDIDRTFKEYMRQKRNHAIYCYTNDLGLVYNRVSKLLKPGENWTEIVNQEVQYLIEIRISDAIRDKNGGATPLVVYEAEQEHLQKIGASVKEVYGEECSNPIEDSKSNVTQTISGNNHQIAGKDLVNKGEK